MAETDRTNMVVAVGSRAMGAVRFLGGMGWLAADTFIWTFRGLVPGGKGFSGRDLAHQIVRVGAKSLPVVLLVQMFMGVILALQMTPPLKEPWGQEAMVANIIGVAGFRMLGPIVSAVVLSGFAGASIAAELGTMSVAEEIEAMEAMALNPVRFLVVPRVLATFIAMLALTVISDVVIALGGWLTSVMVLGPGSYVGYWERMNEQLVYADFVTGMIQGGVFGLLISTIACRTGLSVRGGAEGVGRATTMTVVYSIFSIILAACVFTVIFYVYDF